MAKFYVNVDGQLEEVGKGNSAYDLAVFNGYIGTEQEWLASLHGADGSTVTLNPTNKHWIIDGIDTGVVAEGIDGITPHIDSDTKHWMIGDTDTNIVAQGVDGNTPYINASNNWEIDGTDTGVKAKGIDGITPSIDSLTKHWMLGSTDTGIIAEAQDGVTPQIDPSTKHWMIDGVDTNIIAEGVDGVDGSTPTIDPSTKHWFIDGQDTGIIAEGTNGIDGKDGKSISSITKDDDNNLIVTFTDGSTQNIGKLSVDIQGDFLTSDGFGNLRYYNGYFQYYDESSSNWIDTSVTPSNVYIMNMTPQAMKKIFAVYDTVLCKYKLKFEEPDDTIINGQVACIVDKVIIRRKLGSVPISETDGDLVLEIKRKDFGTYKNEYFVDTTLSPSDGEIFYYKAFPMSTTGFYNINSANETDGIKCKDYNLYGFKLDQNESDPASMITYLDDCDNKYYESAKMNYTTDTFNYGDWADAWFIKGLKPCMLKYDGTVDYELDKNDYSKKLDGSSSDITNDSYDGNAMVGVPKVYWKVTNINNHITEVRFSDKKVDSDYVCWSHLDNNGNEIPYCYMPCYTGAIVNDKLRSLSGKSPIHSYSGTSEISYAIANNQTDDTIWYTETFSDRMLINMLLLLIGKSTDTQTIFGNGHYTGGNGAGSNIASGTMNAKGLFYGTNGTWTGVKVFGMEHYWGNQWRRIAGWINSYGTQKIKLTYGQSDGSTVDGYNTDGTGYIEIPNSTPNGSSGGYISKLLFGNYGYIPVISNGSATTYCCDGLWFNNRQIDYALVGGRSSDGYVVGAFSSDLCDVISDASWSGAAALSCKPLA